MDLRLEIPFSLIIQCYLANSRTDRRTDQDQLKFLVIKRYLGKEIIKRTICFESSTKILKRRI